MGLDPRLGLAWKAEFNDIEIRLLKESEGKFTKYSLTVAQNTDRKYHQGNQVSYRGREIFTGWNLVMDWGLGSRKVVRGDTKMSPGWVSPGLLLRGVVLARQTIKKHVGL